MHPQGLLQTADVCTLIFQSFEKRTHLKSNLNVPNFTLKYLKSALSLNQERRGREIGVPSHGATTHHELPQGGDVDGMPRPRSPGPRLLRGESDLTA